MKKTAEIIFEPGQEYSIERQKWMGCPSIERTGKRTWIAWFTGGKFEPCIYNYAVVSHWDDGEPIRREPYLAIVCHPEDGQRICDSQLWLDPNGRLWLYWMQDFFLPGTPPSDYDTPGEELFAHFFQRQQVWAMYTDDPESDHPTWSDPFYLADGYLRNRPIALRDGTILMPAYNFHRYDRYCYFASKDAGMTVTVKEGPVKTERVSFDEPIFVEYEDGSLHFFARTTTGYIAESSSLDGGETWTPTVSTKHPNPCTRFYIGWLKNGMLLLVNTPSSTMGDGTGLVAYLAEADGKTWPYSLVLDDRRSTTYPDVAQGEDGRLYIIYDCQRDNRQEPCEDDDTKSNAAKEICLAVITVEDIMKGKLDDPNSVLRSVVYRSNYNDRVIGQDVGR